MNIRVVDSIEEVQRHLGLPHPGRLLEPDLDQVENDTERHGRKRRDAEILCTLAANAVGDALELGTSHGRGAFKLATNLAHGSRCHTVNILPEQHDASGGRMVTHLIDRDAIGSYYRERGLANVEQHFANTARWDIPPGIRDLGLIFVDAAHDEENVYLDSKLVWNRLAPGGFIVWHDFSPFSRHFDWVDASMRGVERFLREFGLEQQEILNLRHSWCGILRKPDAPLDRPLESQPAARGEAQSSKLKAQSTEPRGKITQVTQVEVSHPSPISEIRNPHSALRTPHSALPIPHSALRTPHSLRFAVVYPWYSDARRAEDERLSAALRGFGYDVEAIGLPCPGGWWHFSQLDAKWRSQSPDLMTMYEQLEERLRGKDVLIASGGPMLHPEFIRRLHTFNVWVCADDPESSETLSRPAAPAFDFAFPINIACVDDYRRWGCRRVEWLFAPVRPELCAPELTEDAILTGARDLDAVLLCERVFNLSDRAQRIERLVREFPNAYVRGPGWPGGAVEAPPVYRRARIGWNLHNSSGPCNTRTTMLPAFGVLQICDNKSNLGKMFALDREVVGFDSLEECIDRTRYYLAHDDERRAIAAAGWKRVLRDYTLERWWERLVSHIVPALAESRGSAPAIDAQVEIRCPMSEVRKKSEARGPNGSASTLAPDSPAPGPARNGDSDFGLLSDIGNSDLGFQVEPVAPHPPQANLDLPVLTPAGEKPRVLMLVDRRGWAYDTAAQAISKRLGDEFEFRIEYVREHPDLNAWAFDLIYVFFWGETYHQKFVNDPRRVIKEISSHRWATEDAYGRLTAEQAAARYLADAGTLTATSRRLQSAFAPYREVHWCPNGFETDHFAPAAERSGPLRIGWAGNRNDACKGLHDVLQPAAGEDFELVLAGGDLDVQAMGEFYRSIDVLCIASTAEGEPLTLVEGMAAGAFPVAVDVGIVPELVRHAEDGLIVARKPAAFQAAFQWCRQNVDRVRHAGLANARRLAAERRWDDVAGHWRRALRSAYRGLSPVQDIDNQTSAQFLERNLGVNLGQWPERAQAAAQAIAALPLPSGGSVIDMGCGHQTLKPLLPASLTYVPVDRLTRAPGVTVMDFNQKLPSDRSTVATFLGVLEYFADAPRLIRWAAGHVRYLVLSYNDCSNPARREAQHWASPLGFAELEETIRNAGGHILTRQDLGRAEFLYVVEFAATPHAARTATGPRSQRPGPQAESGPSTTPVPPAPKRLKSLALFSAAVDGDNSGDALIVDAIQRLLGAHPCRTFPLLQPLTDAQIEEINGCDLAVIGGTNLYQHVFACALTPAILARIRIPILPLGIGSSAPLGGRPAMDADGTRAVRMIHERCAIGSVRDPATLDFVRSLGIGNVELTGCPVLFHALTEPRFLPPSTERVFLSVRARLLHVEEHWNAKQRTTLRRLARDLRPTLILQSPYDLPIAEDLAREFGLDSLHDDQWGARPMIEGVAQATRTVGFRLHFGMLSLAYGRPATFLATDTRTSAFCDMVGVPYHAVQTYRDEDLIAELNSPQPQLERFLVNWRSLRSAMARLLAAHGLEPAL